MSAPTHVSRARRFVLHWPLWLLPCLGLAVIAALAKDPPVPPPAAEFSVQEIDRRIEEQWKKAGIPPARSADDATFLRRLSIDLRGGIPELSEVSEFTADRRADKRERKVDQILASDEFADYWAGVWTQVLVGKPLADRAEGYGLFRNYLVQAFKEDRPFDQITREVVSATGWIDENPAAYFIRRWDAHPNDLAATVSRAFLGVSLRCAQCHNHPFDAWKREDFWRFAAFFTHSAVDYPEDGTKTKDADGTEIDRYRVDEADEGEADVLPEGQRPLVRPPRFLKEPTDAPTTEPRRDQVARWITSPSNPWFARAVVNRTWAHFLGRGFLHPVENVKESTAPSHPELMERWARDFASHGFQVKRLIRQVVLSRAYQLDSEVSGESPKPALFAAAERRRLTNFELYVSICKATGIEFDLKAVEQAKETVDGEMQNPETQSAKGEIAEVATTYPPCVYLREFEVLSPVESVLLGFNSTLVSHGLLHGHQIEGTLADEPTPERRIRRLFLCALTREPSRDELNYFLPRVEGPLDDPEPYRRVLWTLMNSTEFAHRR